MRTRASSLVGRDSELDTLDGMLRDAGKGRGSAAFIVGEAGIGKSRLAAEAIGRAIDEQMVVLRGRASATGPNVPFRPLTEALLSLLRRGVSLSDDALGPYRPVLGRLVPEWNNGEPSRHGDSLIVLAEAILRLTAVVGGTTGCLLFLDDLHDGDIETLAVVEYICDNLHSQSTVLLATVRTEPSAALDLVHSAARRQSCVTVELGRLACTKSREFVASCLAVEIQEIPESLADRLWKDSAGVPFVVEELLHGMVSGGHLVHGPTGWRLIDDVTTELPPTLTRSIADRAERLGPGGRQLCSVAAVLGRRFSLTVVQRVTGMDDHALLGHLHAGVEAQLIARDDRGPDWYSFQHPLTVEALRGRLTPADRADISRRAADVIAEVHPGLPGEWCQLAAMLRLGADEPVAAGKLFDQAGRRALEDGAAGSAVALLDQAEKLLAAAGEAALRAGVAEMLLYALAEHGQFDRAFELAGSLTTHSGVDQERRVALHVRLAWAAHIAGRWGDGMAQVDQARAILPIEADVELTAPVDAIAAYLALDGKGPDRMQQAEALARRLVDAGERVADPAVLCQAWHVIGTVARERDLAEARVCFDRAKAVASANHLPIWQVYASIGSASITWLSDCDGAVLRAARDAALEVGAVTLAENMSASIALHSVLCGDFAVAAEQIETSLTAVRRLRLAAVERYLLMARGVLAAHQGKRAEMELALAEFRHSGGHRAQELPLAIGLAGAMCALLEEDLPACRRELDKVVAAEAENPTTFYLAGTHGLLLLLEVLDGRMDADALRAAAGSAPATMRWNKQFVLLAEAVLLGRAGRAQEAAATVDRSRGVSVPFEMARHLGLRLVAEAAHTDGWGEPAAWLREAEEYFHRSTAPSVASTCRTLLRRIGEPIQQRRAGTDRVPPQLRAVGVTIREFEVFELLTHRLGNKGLANRLHISPRTVEKHVASLIAKIGSADRAALVEYALAMSADATAGRPTG
ncbi:AAA family ATPase [Actinokineospora sp.]|uniref:AAA family ATPase n=1 Tax=Actinokineospora sp. TaxID=1872133 RepID=UPI00403837FD